MEHVMIIAYFEGGRLVEPYGSGDYHMNPTLDTYYLIKGLKASEAIALLAQLFQPTNTTGSR